MIEDEGVHIEGEEECPEDRGKREKLGKKGLDFAEVDKRNTGERIREIMASVIPTSLNERTIIDYPTNEVSGTNTEIRHGEMKEDLSGFCPNVFKA